jgi:hypothetical protein
MSGRALTYLTDFFGTDSDAEVRKSTLWTAYWESIGSAFGRLGFVPNVRCFQRPFVPSTGFCRRKRSRQPGGAETMAMEGDSVAPFTAAFRRQQASCLRTCGTGVRRDGREFEKECRGAPGGSSRVGCLRPRNRNMTKFPLR